MTSGAGGRWDGRNGTNHCRVVLEIAADSVSSAFVMYWSESLMSSLAVCDVAPSAAFTSTASNKGQSCSLLSQNFDNASRMSSRIPCIVCCAFNSPFISSNLFAMFVIRRFDEVRRENVAFKRSAIACFHRYNSGQIVM